MTIVTLSRRVGSLVFTRGEIFRRPERPGMTESSKRMADR